MNTSEPASVHLTQLELFQRMLGDRQFHIGLGAGIVVVGVLAFVLGARQPSFPQSNLSFLSVTLFYPLAEEIVFRGLLQGWFSKRYSGKSGPISHANLITSTLFALSHLLHHTWLWSLGTFIPSLVFGHFRDRYQQIQPAILLHIFYNTLFFLFFPLPT